MTGLEDATYRSVMLIDDDEKDIFIHKKILKENQFASRIEVHKSGQTALALLKEIEAQNVWHLDIVPQVIFLDMEMPLLNGLQFLEEYKQLQIPENIRIRVVVLSSFLRQEDINKLCCHSAVCCNIIKPLTHEKLLKAFS